MGLFEKREKAFEVWGDQKRWKAAKGRLKEAGIKIVESGYYETEPPRLSVRLQEIFGMTESPRVAGGRVAVVMDILSPAMRTVQVTSDLAGFWKDSYFLVRKEMRGRYPKHDWPEDPLQALPHRGRTKKCPLRG